MDAQLGRVVLLGDLIVDVFMDVDEYPQHGNDSFARHLETQVGGGVINTALVLASLGVPVAPLVAAGEDAWAVTLRERLGLAGIDLRGFRTSPGKQTGVTFVAVTPDGERTMFTYRGANDDFRPEDIDPEILDGAAGLHLSSYALLEQPKRDALWLAVRLAAERGVPVSLDLTGEVVRRRPAEVLRLLPALDVVVLGRAEMEWLGDASSLDSGLDRLLEWGIALAAVKLGRAGCLLADAHQRLSLPAFAVEAVDSTGAGDAFSAGIVYARQCGLSLPGTAVLASALGALAATVPGAGLALPGKGSLVEFLQAQAQTEAIEEVLRALTMGD